MLEGIGEGRGSATAPPARDCHLAKEGKGVRNHMNLLWAIIVGLIAGVLAKLIMPGRDPGGMLVTIGIGIAGSVIANLLGRAMGWYVEGESAGIIGSTVGAILLLIIYRMFKGRGHHPTEPYARP